MLHEKLKYSKCPNCNKYGLLAWGKTSRGRSPIIACEFCHEKFRINYALSVVAIFSIPLLWAFLARFLNANGVLIPNFFYFLMCLISFSVFEYFAPLERVNKAELTSKEHTKNEKEDVGLFRLMIDEQISLKDTFLGMLKWGFAILVLFWYATRRSVLEREEEILGTVIIVVVFLVLSVLSVLYKYFKTKSNR